MDWIVVYEVNTYSDMGGGIHVEKCKTLHQVRSFLKLIRKLNWLLENGFEENYDKYYSCYVAQTTILHIAEILNIKELSKE